MTGSANPIDSFSYEFKKGLLGGKKFSNRLAVFVSRLEGEGFMRDASRLSQYTVSFNIPIKMVKSVSEQIIENQKVLQIAYNKYNTHSGTEEYAEIVGIDD